MTSRCRFAHLGLESLEGRDTPSNFTVTFSAVSHTLAITGDSANNSLTVQGDAGDPTKFQLASSSDTFNHKPGPFNSRSGVKSITIRLLGGDDSVTFMNTVPIDLKGNLSINVGDGVNSVSATDLKVEKNFSITYGIHASGAADTLTFDKLEVGGATTWLLGDGDNSVTIDDSVFVGKFTLTTGSGNDSVSLDHTAGTSLPTIFVGPVLINQGAGNNSLATAGFDDANEELICLSTFVVHHGASAVWFHNDSQAIFPFGGSIQWVL
jgi:hypothetical protein